MNYEDIIKSKHLILTDEGVFQPEYRMMYKGTMDQRLQSHIEKQPLKFMNISSMAGKPMHLSRLKSQGNDAQSVTLVTTQLKMLRFNTTFEVIDKGIFERFPEEHKELMLVDGLPDKWLSPTFNNDPEGNRNLQTYTLDWEVPPYMNLYITMEYLGKAGSGGSWTPRRSYLHCKILAHERSQFFEECKGWFTLPTGNVYDNSEICFGESYLSDNGIIEATKKNIDLFYSTPWNSDLMGAKRNKAACMFRFELESNHQLDLGSDDTYHLCPPHILMDSFSRDYLAHLPV